MRLLPLSRPPLNGLAPRTEREAARDPMDWWDAAPQPPSPRWDRIAGVLLAVAIGVGLAAWLVAWWAA